MIAAVEERSGAIERAVAKVKPPYRVPFMGEIASTPRNGRRVVSTFSGAGGSCLGFEMAGYEIAWASEFVPAAQEVYRLNHPGVPLSTLDIREVDPAALLEEAGLRPGEADVLEGSPPCSDFSTSGKREKGWGKVKPYSDTEQRVDDLFFEYVRILEGVRPKTFVAENVSGLVKGSAVGYFKEILAAMRAAGYRVSARMLDAAWLGVPQQRQRLIFVGVREDLCERFGVEPAHPIPEPYRLTVADGIGELADAFDPDRDLYWRMPAGGKTRKLWQRCRNRRQMLFYVAHREIYGTESYFNHRWLDWRKPCPTIPQGSTCIYHPDDPRSVTIREAKRLCGFPDDFELTGRFAKQWERLGRAVPPPMMYRVARTLDEEVLQRIPEGA